MGSEVMSVMNEAVQTTGHSPAFRSASNPGREQPYSRIALIAAILILVVVIGVRGIRQGEFDYNVDESQHAATGQFVASFLHDLPIAHPIHYVHTYYAHYPALSGVLHWPPLFYMAEGLMFTIFGATVVVARLTIILFALIVFYSWFRFVENTLGIWEAGAATLLLALLSPMLLFTKVVMLEMPALAFCIPSAYFWTKYLLEEKPGHAYWFAVTASAALLTKHNSIYLAMFCVLSLVFVGRWRLLICRQTWIALGIVIALVGPFYGAVYATHWQSIAKDLNESLLPGLDRYTFYLRALPGQLGWPLLGLSLLGMGLAWRSRQRFYAKVMFAWILACYLAFTFIGHMEARYVIDWLPPFTYFAVLPITVACRARWQRVAYGSVIFALVATAAASAWKFERPYISGYRSIAEMVKTKSNAGVILLDSDVPANFIFFVRALDPAKHFVVLRKSLYVENIKKENGSAELVHTPAEMRNVLAENGVRFVCVSQRSTVDYRSQAILQQVLSKSGQYRLIADVPLGTNERWRQGERILLYENPEQRAPSVGVLRIPMMTLKNDILIPWSELVR